ncbi:MAG: EpsG family protein [Christensenellales bacterium]
MAVYTANLLLVFIFSYLADHFRFRSPAMNLHGENKPLIWFVLFAILTLSMVSGFRFLVGTDYVNYSILYDDLRNSLLPVVAAQQIEIGYAALSAFFGLFSEAPFAFFLFVSVVTNAFIVLALRNYSKMFWLSCVLYILTFFFFTTFNLIRQAMALSIIFYAHKYLMGKNFFKYLLCVLAAALFHTSVLIMIPVYFIVRRPAWSTVIWIGFFGVIVFFILYDSIISALFSVLSGTRYSAYDMVMKNATQGVNILRIVVAAMPVALAFVFRKGIREISPDSNIVVNMTAIAFMITVIAYKQIYFARISLYFNAYYLLLLPYFPRLFKDKRLQLIMLFGILICYTTYCYVLMPKEGGILPYKTIISAPHDWNVMDYIFTR